MKLGCQGILRGVERGPSGGCYVTHCIPVCIYPKMKKKLKIRGSGLRCKGRERKEKGQAQQSSVGVCFTLSSLWSPELALAMEPDLL